MNDSTIVQCFFNVEFTETSSRFDLIFGESSAEFSVDFGEINTIHSGGVSYKGDYTVTPKVTEQILPTANALLKEDIFVKSIPFFDVSNLAGGSTVYIGNEV